LNINETKPLLLDLINEDFEYLAPSIKGKILDLFYSINSMRLEDQNRIIEKELKNPLNQKILIYEKILPVQKGKAKLPLKSKIKIKGNSLSESKYLIHIEYSKLLYDILEKTKLVQEKYIGIIEQIEQMSIDEFHKFIDKKLIEELDIISEVGGFIGQNGKLIKLAHNKQKISNEWYQALQNSKRN
jgi:hypothetical protein